VQSNKAMNIDNFFQEQNEKHTIDTSKQNLHWQQMQVKLGLATPKTKWKPYAMVALIAIAVGTTLYVINSKKDNSVVIKKEESTTNENTLAKESSTTNVLLTPNEKNTTTVPLISATTEVTNTTATPKETIKKTTEPTIELKPLTNSTINKQAQFYIDLTKEPQLFTINPTQEITITCKQGTKITIPANIIVDKNGNKATDDISMIVQEYYRYENNSNVNSVDAGMIKYEFYKGAEKLVANETTTVAITMIPVVKGANIKIMNATDAMPETQLMALQWVSAEKFTTDKRQKIDYKITLDKNYDASTFMSQIAFPKEKVVMAGDIVKNSIIFHNVPIGETVYFMSIGKIKDKYFSCSKKLVSGNTNIKEIDFIEISETLYKKQIEDLGKLGQ
jgi:hypothetical protein